MTDSNQPALLFSNLGRRRIEADFAGGKLTSDAGAALLREVDRRIGLIDALADCIVDPRQPAKITHDLRTMLAQRILAMALGYEDLNDHDSLRHDPLLQIHHVYRRTNDTLLHDHPGSVTAGSAGGSHGPRGGDIRAGYGRAGQNR